MIDGREPTRTTDLQFQLGLQAAEITGYLPSESQARKYLTRWADALLNVLTAIDTKGYEPVQDRIYDLTEALTPREGP